MPLWVLYHSPGAFSPEEKKDLAQKLTKVYYRFPDFYVNVVFLEIPPGDFFIGGEVRPEGVHITIRHAARHLGKEDQAVRDEWIGRFDAVLTSFFSEKNLDWEYSVEDVPRELWKINGIFPPELGSEEEKVWAKAKRAVPL
jgi:phenylpyruvate tautomerase PptA (4-oxalocrotonate tautomerase family)